MIKIYCIECLETGEKYIGSTQQKLIRRIGKHRRMKWNDCSSKQIIDRDNYKYYIIEEVEDSQRYIREQYHMDNTDNCINRQRAIGYDKKEYKKLHYKLNKESLNKRDKEHYKLNRESIIKKQLEYQKYRASWGGDKRSHNNLCEISLDLFN